MTGAVDRFAAPTSSWGGPGLHMRLNQEVTVGEEGKVAQRPPDQARHLRPGTTHLPSGPLAKGQRPHVPHARNSLGPLARSSALLHTRLCPAPKPLCKDCKDDDGSPSQFCPAEGAANPITLAES